MNRHPEWNDLKVFLAVARLRTISDAGEKLGIEHSTVSRRIDRLESSLNAVLFDRRRTGYSLTDAGHALIPHAEKMESALLAAVEESQETADIIRGTVRVGTPEAFGINVLAPGLAQLRQNHPRLHIELMAQPQFPSLAAREVEILVTLDPPAVGRYKIARMAQIDYFLCGSPSYLKRHAPIHDLRDLVRHDFVDYIHDGSVSERYRVLEELVHNPTRCFTSNSVLAQRSAAAAGMGLVLLTPYVANSRQGDLIHVFPDMPLITRNIWIAGPQDLLKIKRYQFVWRFIREQVELHSDCFHPPA